MKTATTSLTDLRYNFGSLMERKKKRDNYNVEGILINFQSLEAAGF